MQALNLLVFGAPGSGVSTLSKNLSKELNFQYVSLRNRSTPPDSGDPISINNQELAKLQRQLQETKGHVIDGSPCQLDFSTEELDGIIYLMTPRVNRLHRIREREMIAQGGKILEEGCKELKFSTASCTGCLSLIKPESTVRAKYYIKSFLIRSVFQSLELMVC